MTTTNGTTTMSPVAKIRALHDRLLKAEALVASGKVHPIYGMADHYFVEGKEAKYLVNGTCICPDATNRPEIKGLCKHKLAATIYAEQEAIANNLQVAKATKPVLVSQSPEHSEGGVEGKAAPPETDPELERQIQELYH
jgi:hypothetical protein